MQAAHLKQLRDALLGKDVSWRLRVTKINSSSASLQCCGTHMIEAPVTDRFGIRRTEEIEVVDLVVHTRALAGNVRRGNDGLIDLWQDDRNTFLVVNCPPAQLRSLSVGEFALLGCKVVEVTHISSDTFPIPNCYAIRVVDTKIK